MATQFTILDFFSLCAGLAIFLYGMQQGEKSLRIIGGSSLRKVITIITRHRISAYIAGLTTTLITQSSSATTVMLVSLASAHLMTLGQSLGMILGTDLGTTFTVQLFAFKFYNVAPFLIATGYFATLGSSAGKLSGYGKLLMSMGFIFFGMHMMTDSVTPLRSLPQFERMMHASINNPFYGLLAGTLITATIHSSAATLAFVITILQTFQSSTGYTPNAVDFFPVILGANLGTCVTAFLSTLKADIEGVRVAWAHFAFKLLGTIIIFPFTPLIQHLDLFASQSPAFQIAIYHTLFSVFISVLFLPLLNPFERALIKLIQPSRKTQQRFKVHYIHENTINIPLLALTQAKKEITGMSELITSMLIDCKGLLEHFNPHKKQSLLDQDDEVDFLHENIVKFLTQMSREELKPDQGSMTYEYVMITTDLEHIGDIVSKLIASLAEKIESSPLPLSSEGKQEILEFYDMSIANFKDVIAAFIASDLTMAQRVYDRKNENRITYDKLFERHMNRLYIRKPESLQTTAIHSDLLEEIRRINHFSFRIAAHMLQITKSE